MTEPKPPSVSAVPYGKAVGLFAASVTTLIGVARNVGPEVILGRAVVAGLACGIVARLATVVLNYLARTVES